MIRNPLGRFVIAVLAWLPVTFAVWYFAAPVILWPAQLLAQLAVNVGVPDLIQAVEPLGANVLFTTTLRPGQAAQTGFISVEVNPLLYAFGLPMFAALILATHEPGWWKKLAIGYVALLPIVAFGIVADFLKNIAITANPLVASQAGFSALQRDVIAFAFQFGSLILPTVVPAILWVLLDRGFLERMRGRIAAAEKPGTAT